MRVICIEYGKLGAESRAHCETHPSIVIEPDDNSTMRNKASISELFPAPVLK